jgi:hypothetical protein
MSSWTPEQAYGSNFSITFNLLVSIGMVFVGVGTLDQQRILGVAAIFAGGMAAALALVGIALRVRRSA